MKEKDLNKIIDNYLDGKASPAELEVLKEFEGFAESKIADKIFKNTREKEVLKKEMLLKILNKNSKRKKNYYRYAIAASVMLFVALSVFLNNSKKTELIEPITITSNNSVQPGTDKATLTLEDGTVVPLKKGSSFRTKNAVSNGNKIVYQDNSSLSSFELVFNYLTVPRGGQFFIELSDGTKVWLNSESQLKYPVSFIEGQTREVELVYGEAYFEVSHSTEHNGSKFKVVNKSQEVEVLGTEFNIKAYKDEDNVYTTLVKGKVAVTVGEILQELTPSQQSKVDSNTKNLTVSTVDVYNEVSWKDGIFSFDGKQLGEIMKVLSRWYDVDIIFTKQQIKEKEFVGILDKDQKIEDILTSITSFGIIEDFKINEKTIVLK